MELIKKQKKKEKVVLGLATGSTPKSLYAELVRLHKEEGLSFKNVVTFNLDEYYPIERQALQSYYRFMHQQLFDHIDINPKNINIPNGEIEKEKIKEHCKEYEKRIEVAGGIDLQILGIGNNGHIGFNEPGSGLHSKTRLINLDNSTRLANSYEFANIAEVPRLALTMGIYSILQSKKIILMAWGTSKAPVIKKAVEEEMTESLPASLLQMHDDVQFVIDQDAATELTRFKSPWLTGECEWTPRLIKKAVVNMALALKKPVLSLTNSDYNEFGLGDLLVEKGDAYEMGFSIVPLLLLGYLLLGIYFNLSIWFKLTDKTNYSFWITFLGAIVSVAGIVFLVPVWGFMGAALSTVACYLVMVAVCYFFGQKYYPIPYQTNRGLGYLILAFALSYFGYFLETGVGSLDFILKNSGALLFIAAVFFVERKFVRSLIAKKS